MYFKGKVDTLQTDVNSYLHKQHKLCVGVSEATAIRLEAIVIRFEAIASRCEAIALRLDAITIRVESIPIGYWKPRLCVIILTSR